MSCRVRRPEDAPGVEPVVWRPVAPAPGAGAAADSETVALRAQLDVQERQAEQRTREAHAAGIREGEAAGRTRTLAEVEPVLARLARSIEEIGGLRARLRAEAEADLLQLALAIARRVLRREIALDPEALRGLALGALARLDAQEISRVRTHPSHAQALGKYLADALGAGRVEIVADPSREVGSVIFETPRGNLDAGIESQLQEIERGLADRLRRAS